MHIHHKSHSSPGAYAGILQVRGDLGLKLALLLLTVHVLSARITSEIKATASLPAQAAPKPTLKVFIDAQGALRLDSKGPAVSTPQLQAAFSNIIAQADGRPAVVALCLPKNQMTDAVIKAGLAASLGTNIETTLTVSSEL
jgi:biopolymer transport protein ExbD